MDFTELLQKAEKLAKRVGKPSFNEEPTHKYTLGTVLKDIAKLNARLASDELCNSKTNYFENAEILCASNGIDLQKMTEQLEILKFCPLLKRSTEDEDDLETFLQTKKRNVILNAITREQFESFYDYGKQKLQTMQNAWNTEKDKILVSLTNEIPIGYKQRRQIAVERERIEAAFSQAIEIYNAQLLKGDQPRNQLLQIFTKIAMDFKSSDAMKFGEMWNVLSFVLNPVATMTTTTTSSVVLNEKCAPNRQLFAQEIDIRARNYLERRFKWKLFKKLRENLRLTADLAGGMPIILYNQLKAYVGIQIKEKQLFCNDTLDTLDSLPLWQLVYYALRCGSIKNALEYLHEVDAFVEHKDFCAFFEQKLNTAREEKIFIPKKLEQYYQSRVKYAADTYKIACYCIILGCDLMKTEKCAEICKTYEDFLWLQLAQNNKNLETMTSEIKAQYNLTEAHLKQRPFAYFVILALTGQYELAIEFLLHYEKLKIHGIHMAIALNELCLLNLPNNLDKPMLSTATTSSNMYLKDAKCLNFGNLIMQYCKDFQLQPSEHMARALHYYHLLRQLKNNIGVNLFAVCICNLALDTTAYTQLFGSIVTATGCTIGGLYAPFEAAHGNQSHIATLIATKLVQNGKLEESVLLYNIAGNYDLAIQQLCNLLSNYLTQKSDTNLQIPPHLYYMAGAFMLRIKDYNLKVIDPLKTRFYLIYNFTKYYNRVAKQQPELALQTLAALEPKLIPLDICDLDICISNLKHLNKQIQVMIPMIVLSAMRIIKDDYVTLKRLNESHRQLSYWQKQAKAMSLLVTSLPHRIPSYINAEIIRLELQMQ